MRLDPSVYERAAEINAASNTYSCWAIEIASSRRQWDRYLRAYRAVFTPEGAAWFGGWWGEPYIANPRESKRMRLERSLALLLMAQMIRTGDAP